jgi:hypothetical protein
MEHASEEPKNEKPAWDGCRIELISNSNCPQHREIIPLGVDAKCNTSVKERICEMKKE